MKNLAIVAAFSAFGVGACASAVDGSEGADELMPPEAVTDEVGEDVSMLQLGAPGTQYTMRERGGSGGSPAPSLRGSVIYAMRVNTGRLVDQVNLAYYVPSRSDNLYRSGDFYDVLGPIGGSGGTYHDWTYCPGGYGAVGIQGRAADKVDAVGLICADLTNSSRRVTLPVHGGSGGQGFYDECAQGYLMTGVNLRSGRVVDRIQGVCQKER